MTQVHYKKEYPKFEVAFLRGNSHLLFPGVLKILGSGYPVWLTAEPHYPGGGHLLQEAC